MKDDPFKMFEQWCRENGFADVAEPPRDGRTDEEIREDMQRVDAAIEAYDRKNDDAGSMWVFVWVGIAALFWFFGVLIPILLS